MAVTIKQVAQRSGLSLMTVSYILNDKRGRSFRPETRDKVFAAAEMLGYRRNSAAKAISTGRFGSVALLQSAVPLHCYLPGGLLNGIHDALATRDLTLTLTRLSDEKLTDEEFVPKILREWSSDGLLLDYITDIPQRLVDIINRHRIPAIWINSKHAQNCVHPDDSGGAYEATRRLLELGHRRIAYVAYIRGYVTQSPHYSEGDRKAGYEKAMLEAGLAPQVIRYGQPIAEEYEVTCSTQWLSASNRPTAVLTYSTREPRSILVAARDLGLRVPQDLTIAGFDSESSSNVWGVDVGGMRIEQHRLGAMAVEMLFKRIEAGTTGSELPAVALSPVWSCGQTVGPAPVG